MNRKTKILIAVLTAVCSSLILFSILQKHQAKKTVPLIPTPSPVFTPTPFPVPSNYFDVFKEQEDMRKNYYPLLDKTPYRTILFELSYSGPLKLKVIMFDKNQAEIKNEVYLWIQKNGIDPNTHQIEFVWPTPPTLAP